MIISSKRNFIFVHIPKTGGTSLSLALEARAAADDILIGDTPKAKRRRKRQKDLVAPGRLWKHSRFSDIEGMTGMPQNPFVFTIVRSPWDRMVSLYFWAKSQSFDHPIVDAAKRFSFEDFLVLPGVVGSLRKDSARHYVSSRCGKERCDVFLRLEFLERDIVKLEDHLGFKLDVPHVNSSARPRTEEVYSKEMIDHVAQIFDEDIARFGYEPPQYLASNKSEE